MKRFNVTVNGNSYDVQVKEITGAAEAYAPVPKPPQAAKPATASAQSPSSADVKGTPVTAPMPGTILDIKISEGDSVKRGQALMVLEALKMENDIVSPCDGKVVKITAVKGASVKASEPLALIQ